MGVIVIPAKGVIVIPAKAGIHSKGCWIPAIAGMTNPHKPLKSRLRGNDGWFALLLTLLLLCTSTFAQTTDSLVLTNAQLTVTLNGEEQPAQNITLPLHWDVTYPKQAGVAELSIEFDRPAQWSQQDQPYMLFTPRIGNAYSIALNGIVIATAGDLDDLDSMWSAKHPVGITFPANLLAEHNLLVLTLRADALRNAGVATPELGPLAVMEPVLEEAYAWRVMMGIVCSLVSILVAGFCLLLWFQQRESLFAWASLGEAMWAVVVADVYWESLPLPWSVWQLVLPCLRAVWVWTLYAFTERVFAPHPALERKVMWMLIPLLPISVVASSLADSYVFFNLVRITLWLLFVVMVLRTTWSLRAHATSERVLLVVSLAVLLAFGVHDEVVENYATTGFSSVEWVKYSGSLLAFTIMWIVSKRFRQARVQAQQLQASLEQRVAQKERELRESFTRLSQAEQSRAIVAERERILRDMHDGVGANLATAMRQLESGTAANTDVAETLRESLLHLKLSIDAMNLPTGDINSLLASLRYRLQPRLESAGLALAWEVDLLPLWQRGNDQMMRHLQFLLLEAISNVLQHAKASTLTLIARTVPLEQQTIEIVLSDDGKGMANDNTRGLQSIRERAKAIDAQLTITPATPGTRLMLRLSSL